MSIATKLQNILDNMVDDAEISVEVDDCIYSVSKLKVTYQDDEPIELVLVADYD